MRGIMTKRVVFNYRSGRVDEIELRYATILQKLGHGTYKTRDMRPEPVLSEMSVTIETEPEQPPKKRGRPAKNKD